MAGFDATINAHSLGGLPLASGGTTAPSIWRSASPDALDTDGWAAVIDAGVTRVVDLRNESERGTAPHRPRTVSVIAAPLEDPDDPDYAALWDGNWAHPDFYGWGIGHWPELWRGAIGAIADAPEGAVLVHCAGGRDRTGMVAAILLEIAGVERDAVLADHARGMRGTNELLRRSPGVHPERARSDEELDSLVLRFRGALSSLLDRLPILLAESELDEPARRAAARLLEQD